MQDNSEYFLLRVKVVFKQIRVVLVVYHTFAALTRQQTIVVPRHFIATNRTQFIQSELHFALRTVTVLRHSART